MSEKIKLCSTCKNCKRDIQRGIVCNLTDAKPEFDFSCDNYLNKETDNLYKKDESINTRCEEDSVWDLKGANWFGAIAALSFFNIIMYAFDQSFIFGLGITQVLQSAIVNQLIPPFLGIICILILPAFFLYTWWLSDHKGYKLCYNIGCVVYLLDTLLLTYFCIKNPEASSLIVDIIIHIGVLIAGFKIFYVNSEVCKVNTMKWNFEKLGFLLFTAVAITISIYSLVVVIDNLSVNSENIHNVVDSINKDLPKEVEEGVVLERIDASQDSLVYIFKLKDEYISDFDTNYLTDFVSVRKHEMLFSMCKDPKGDELVTTCLNNGYIFVSRTIDAISRKIYDVVITPEEYQRCLANGEHVCPFGEISNLINKYAAELPIEYLGGMKLNNISLSSDNTTIIYDVKLPQMTSDEFSSVTPSYLNDFIKSNLTDIMDYMMRLAIVNQMTICFDVSTNSGIKYTKVNITPEFYNRSSN